MSEQRITIPKLTLGRSSSPRPKCEPVSPYALDNAHDILSTCPLSFHELVRCIKQERDRSANPVVMCGGPDALAVLLSLRTPQFLLPWLPDVTLCFSMSFSVLFASVIAQLCQKANTHALYLKGVALDLIYGMLNNTSTEERRGVAVIRFQEFSGNMQIDAVHSVHRHDVLPPPGETIGIATVVNGVAVETQLDSLRLSDKISTLLRAALHLQALDIGATATALGVSAKIVMLLVGTDFAQGSAQYHVSVNSGPHITNSRMRLLARYIVMHVFSLVANGTGQSMTIQQQQQASQTVYSFVLAPSNRSDPLYSFCSLRSDYMLLFSSIGQLETGGQEDMASDLSVHADKLVSDFGVARFDGTYTDDVSAQLWLSAMDLCTRLFEYQRATQNDDPVVTVTRPHTDFKAQMTEWQLAALSQAKETIGCADGMLLWQGEQRDISCSAFVAASVDKEMERRRDRFPVRLTHREFVLQFGALLGSVLSVSSGTVQYEELASQLFEKYLLSLQASIGSRYVLLQRDVHRNLLKTLAHVGSSSSSSSSALQLTQVVPINETKRIDLRRMATVFHVEEQWLLSVCNSSSASLQTLTTATTTRLASGGSSDTNMSSPSLAQSATTVCELVTRMLLSAEAISPRPRAYCRLRWAVLVVLRVLRAGCWELIAAVRVTDYCSRAASAMSVAHSRTIEESRVMAMLVLCDVAVCVTMLTAPLEMRASVASIASALFGSAVRQIADTVLPRRTTELCDSVVTELASTFTMDDLEQLVSRVSVCSGTVLRILYDRLDTSASNKLWTRLATMSAAQLFSAQVRFTSCGNSQKFRRVSEIINLALHRQTSASTVIDSDAGLLANRRWLQSRVMSPVSSVDSGDADADDVANPPYSADPLPVAPAKDDEMDCEILELELARRVPLAVTSCFSQ